MPKLISIYLLFCVFNLPAQWKPGILYTKDNDTLSGSLRIKGPLEVQNKGLEFLGSDQKTAWISPSSVKEIWIFKSKSDTLRLVSVPKSLVSKFVDVEAIDSTEDTHLLIETDLGAGPLQTHIVCSGIEVTHYGPTFVNGRMNPGITLKKPVFKDFISKNYKWARLPDTRYDRNDLLIQTLADCPILIEKLKKDKINPMTKMNKILSLYNQCK